MLMFNFLFIQIDLENENMRFFMNEIPLDQSMMHIYLRLSFVYSPQNCPKYLHRKVYEFEHNGCGSR